MVLKRIVPLSVAKITGILYAFIGVIAGFFMWMFSSIISSFGGSEAEALGALFGISSIILFPVLYGILGFILGFVMAGLYNVVAERIGGIEVDLS